MAAANEVAAVVYHHCAPVSRRANPVTERSTGNRLPSGRIASTPAYQRMTIRNWNTTTKLLRLMEDADSK